MASPDEDTHRLYHEVPDRTPPLPAGDVGLTFVLAVATFFAVAMFGGGLAGVAAASVIGLVGVPVVVVRSRGLPLTTLGLSWPPPRALLGAALVGASIWYLDLRLAAPIARALDPEREATRHLAEVILTTPIAGIIVLSLVPPFCEELACRGLLTLGLRRRLGAVAAVLISAAAFAALHLSLTRAAPTFALGVAMATLTVRTGSVVPAMLAHALNNAIALLIAAGYLAGLGQAVEDHPSAALLLAALSCSAGLGIAWIARNRRS